VNARIITHEKFRETEDYKALVQITDEAKGRLAKIGCDWPYRIMFGSNPKGGIDVCYTGDSPADFYDEIIAEYKAERTKTAASGAEEGSFTKEALSTYECNLYDNAYRWKLQCNTGWLKNGEVRLCNVGRCQDERGDDAQAT
jgi:hypothetical protein